MISRRNRTLLERHAQGQDHSRWDDVRCYRCGRWRHPEDTAATTIQTAIGGLTVQVCTDTATCTATTEGR